ncbi:DUF29 domain-containing protein [Synechocystis sp. LKSZ1]|uniref:DUF29 domain-containing protein n=1 Tax=Synechocystis sp. LKSZ1 TaxID=3144951 RepID=UPI00336C1870
MQKELYEQDFQEWLKQTIENLKDQQFIQLDLEHLIEELNDLGKSNQRALESNLLILIAHLLKLRVQNNAPETMKVSWLNSVSEDRQRILYDLAEIPSLQSHLATAIAKVYGNARKLAIREGKRASFGVRVPADVEYPEICPFSIAQLLDENFEGQTE